MSEGRTSETTGEEHTRNTRGSHVTIGGEGGGHATGDRPTWPI